MESNDVFSLFLSISSYCIFIYDFESLPLALFYGAKLVQYWYWQPSASSPYTIIHSKNLPTFFCSSLLRCAHSHNNKTKQKMRRWIYNKTKKKNVQNDTKFNILAKRIVLYGYGFDAQLFCLIFILIEHITALLLLSSSSSFLLLIFALYATSGDTQKKNIGMTSFMRRTDELEPAIVCVPFFFYFHFHSVVGGGNGDHSQVGIFMSSVSIQ